MDKFIESGYSGMPFELFSTVHLSALAVILIANIVLILLLRPSGKKYLRSVFRTAFSIFIILCDISFFVWSFLSGYFSVKYALPLQICDVAIILSVIMLLTGNQLVYEITYFWGISGSLHALLTPGLAPYNYPHYLFFSFFILHGVVVTAVLYMTVVENYRPRFAAIWRALAITNVYAAVIFIINLLIDSNYMFLISKPPSPAITDLLGPWPWYLLSLEIIAALSFIICYLPFAVINYFSFQKNRPFTSFNSRL